MDKSLYEISWKVPEEVYRQDSALSYSTLSTFERSGFNELEHLFDRKETPSLTFGSAVDSILTGGQEEFEERFLVAEFPNVADSILPIVKALFNEFHETHNSLRSIPDVEVIGFASRFNYQNNWRPETRAKKIKEEGEEYYKLMYVAQGKTIISTATYQDIVNSVEALRNSDATSYYFAPNNPFENIERLYQLKFKATLNEIDYRCMADLIVVNHDKKTVQPVDLKTSSHTEWDFYKSFVDWNYQIQARLYWRIIRDNMDRDPYFKDFELLDYKFIVVNKRTLCPLVWDFPVTKAKGTLDFKNVTMRDPEAIGTELRYYLDDKPKTPIGIMNENNLVEWLNKI